MRTFLKALRTLSVITLFFFCWTFMPLWQMAAWAAEKQKTGVSRQRTGEKGQTDPSQSPLAKGGSRGVGSGERFEKALEDIREKATKTHHKHSRGEDTKPELDAIKAKKAEIESVDADLQKEFAATEQKLKAAKLPKEILDRHHKFVKHYQENLKELKTNLNDVEKAKTSKDRTAKMQKVREHLEKVKAPKRHKPLDPNNLPHRMVKAKKEKAPRLKKEEFEKDFPQKKKHKNLATLDSSIRGQAYEHRWPRIVSHELTRIYANDLKYRASEMKPVIVAANGSLAGLLSGDKLPLPQGEGWGEGIFPHLASTLSRIDASEPFMVAQAVTNPPTADDLAQTLEIQFTAEIQALAAQLNHNPVKIYEWVRNNIEYVPSYGSIQGANMCFQSMQCNDMDTASLLIALLRSSGIYSHYVYGTVEVPIDKAMNWVGGFSDAKAAATFINSGGIPVKLYGSGATFTKVQMEHVWVEAWIDYIPSRGAVHKQGDTWVPMDASYKQYTYTPGFDLTATVPFNQDTYLSQVQTQNAVHYYQTQIQNYLDANMPDKSVIDVKGYREIQEKTFDYLPASLQYKTIVAGGEFASVPTDKKARVTFTITDASGGADATYTAFTDELAGKRLTISYIPATSADEALISKYGGFLYNVPAYMLNLKPVIKVEGAIVLTGQATTLGSEQSLSFQFTQPSGMNETISKKLIAGAYYAIGMDLQGINENVLGKRNYLNTSNVLSQTAGTLGNDDLIGEHLFILSTTYHLANDKIYKSGAKLYNTALTRTLSEAITSFTVSVDHLFSMPKSAMPSGINMDVAMDRVIAVAKDGNTAKEKAYMEISGLVSSYHEHDIFEKIDGFSSVSAVRALQVARANGIAIQHVTSSNIAQTLPTLQVDPEIKADIQNAINAGKEVTIPQTNVHINDWNGTGYIVKDPITGSGTYMISGGLAGGDSTSKNDGMQIVQIFKGALGWIKDKLDLQTRNTIATAATMNLGEIIVEMSRLMLDMDYSDIDCSQLVRIAYWAAGICLDSGAGLFTNECRNGNNLADKYGISGGNGVSIFFAIAKKQDLAGGVRRTSPLVGDMLFFDNTWDPNKDCIADHPLQHMGIVQRLSVDDKDSLYFIHSSTSYGVVEEELMNINDAYISDPNYNTALRSKYPPCKKCGSGEICPGSKGPTCSAGSKPACTNDVWNSSSGKYSGQLFNSFGTVRNP